MNDTKYIHIIILFFIGIILFLNAGKGEIQPWDEGLYAYRAVSISQSGNYIDQTKESLSGLYSSTSPPFTHWMINSATRVLGESILAIRLFSLVCSLVSVIVLYYIGIRFISRERAIIGSILLSSALLWNTYSRQAMTDIPLISMFLLLLLLIIKYYETGKAYQILIYAVIFSIILSIALLTKIIISLFPLLFVIIYLFSPQSLKKKITISIGSIIGIAIALPWYLFMSNLYGGDFYNALFLPHIATAVENNSRESGVFYYINSLIVSSPILLFLFFSPIRKIKFKDVIKYKTRNHFIYICVLAWFVIMFLIMTISKTKMPHYTNYILVPATILTVYNIDKIKLSELSSKKIFAWLLILFVSFFWSFSFDFRQELKLISKLEFSANVIILFCIFIFAIIVYKYIQKEKILKVGKWVFSDGIIFLSVVLLSRIFFLNLAIPTGNAFGADATIKMIKSMGTDTLVYVFNNYSNSDSLNPQLEWYLYKNYLSKENYIKVKKPIIIKYPIAKEKFKLEELLNLDTLGRYPLVYYVPNYNHAVGASIIEINKTRDFVSGEGNYLLFTKIIRNRIKGLQL